MLKELPKSFYQLKAIEVLNLSGCSKFDDSMTDLGQMVSLRTLLADNTAIREIPSSIIHLSNLEHLSLCGLKQLPSTLFPRCFWSHLLPRRCVKYPPSLSGIYASRELHVRDCNLTDSSFPKDFESLSCLEVLDLGKSCFFSLPSLSGLRQLQDLTLDNCNLTEEAITATNIWTLPSLKFLDLRGNGFHSLPSLRGLSKLILLYLDNCANLHAMPEQPTNLAVLRADGCTALEKMPNFSEILSIRQLNLSDSPKLSNIPGFGKSPYLHVIELEGCINISGTLKEKLLQRGSHTGRLGDIFLPGNDIPPWFMYVSQGGILSFRMPHHLGSNLQALTVCIVYSCSLKKRENLRSIFIYIINHTKHTVFFVRPSSHPKEIISSGVVWQGRFLNRKFCMRGGDNVEICVAIGSGFLVKKIGVDLVLDEYTLPEDDMIRCLTYDARFRRHIDDVDEGEIISASRGVAVAHQQINFNNKYVLWCLIAVIVCCCMYTSTV